MTDMASVQPAPQTTAEDKAASERPTVEMQIIWDETRTLLAGMDATQTIQQGQWEQRCARDRAARDRENMVLRMVNSRLRAERGLPPYDGNSLF
jgi:uncharacterized protein YaaN involved in tellurite resistance